MHCHVCQINVFKLTADSILHKMMIILNLTERTKMKFNKISKYGIMSMDTPKVM